MGKRLINLLRIVTLIALMLLAGWGLMTLGTLHQQACPELYAPGSSDYLWLYLILIAVTLLLTPVMRSVGGLLSGYRLYRMKLLFLEVTQEEKLRFRLTRHMGYGTSLVPPRTDGTSPYRLALLSQPLLMTALAALLLGLAAIFWRTGAARVLLIIPFFCLGATTVCLLPRRDGSDDLSLLLAFHNKDRQRAWECALHITAALSDGRKLADLPEEWFHTYPAEIADDLYVFNCIIIGSSRLIRQRRFAEGYDMLQPLFSLQPTPETHHVVACALINGAICEALADRPANCLNQLEHNSIKYMLPLSWKPRLLTAKYARALLIDRDDAAAAALLDEIGKTPDPEKIDADLLRLLQEKAGLTTKEDAP